MRRLTSVVSSRRWRRRGSATRVEATTSTSAAGVDCAATTCFSRSPPSGRASARPDRQRAQRDLGVQQIDHAARRIVGDLGGLDHPVGLVAGQLALDAHPRPAAQHQVVAAVGQRLGQHDLAHPGDGRHLGRAVELVVLAQLEGHGQQLVALQHVPGQLAVARLEDVQGQEGVGQQHHVPQREHGQPGERARRAPRPVLGIFGRVDQPKTSMQDPVRAGGRLGRQEQRRPRDIFRRHPRRPPGHPDL